MKTIFARWLWERDIPAWRFAAEHRIHRVAVARLAGIRLSHDKTPVEKIRWYETPGRVAEITGLPLDQLISEAIQAMHDPAGPRRYRRKETAE